MRKWLTMDASRNDLAFLLQELLDTLESAGSFHEWTLADDDSGLPFVYDKLCRALELAKSGHVSSPPHQATAETSHRLQ
jgi:hypothetical protein